MRLLLFLSLFASAVCAQVRVEIRDSEVWLIRNERPKQLTHDGRSKLQVLYSAIFNRIAYYEQCIEGEHCMGGGVTLKQTC